MSTVPAAVFRLPEGGGTLRPGAPADVTVLDVAAPWTVDPAAFFSKSRNTPFAGRTLTGRAVLTLVGGKIVHDAALSPEPLSGRLARATWPGAWRCAAASARVRVSS